jgi:hypothetical protein
VLFIVSVFFLVTISISYGTLSTLARSGSEDCDKCLNEKCGQFNARKRENVYKASLAALISAVVLVVVSFLMMVRILIKQEIGR